MGVHSLLEHIGQRAGRRAPAAVRSAITTEQVQPSTSRIRFLVLSTFRDERDRQVRPHGRQWNLAGKSRIAYVLAPDSPKPTQALDDAINTPEVIKGLVEAHNLWSFAKGLPFVSAEDVQNVSVSKRGHVHVNWNPSAVHERVTYPSNVIEAVRADESSLKAGHPAEVWVNGVFVGVLDGPDTLGPVLAAVRKLRSVKLHLRRSERILRVERYFRGMIRGEEVFEHLMDNLIALEDAEILDDQTIIGTATLPDWIMGGELTSRLWVRDDGRDILTLRPLYNDKVATADRRYELVSGVQDRRIATVRQALKDVRFLASHKM